MIKEAVINTPETTKTKKHKAEEKGNLKQRGYLNILTSIIDYAGGQITGLIVSPFIVNGLGSAMYGIWQMLGQMTGYAKMADTRATQVLKWTVAKKQDTADVEELRSDISSALVVTAFILPLVLIGGGIISWYAPIIAKADPAYYNLIRITSSLLIFSLVISKVFDLFESVIRGLNLSYKRMGLRTVIIMGGGALKVLAITQGFGLIGLSVVHVIVSLVMGLSYYVVVKKHVPWFGFGKTNLKKVLGFSKLSGWYMANTASDTLLSNSDKILLGFIAGPVLVSYYALTTFIPLAIQGLISRVIIGIVPGIGKLFGLKEYAKINKVWGNLNDFVFLLTTSCGVGIILFNQSFLRFWVGEEHFAGHLANALIMLMVIQDTFIKLDSFIISATLDLKKRVYLSLMASVVFIGLGFILVNNFGIAGLCLSIICGKFLLFIGQRSIIRKKVKSYSIAPLYKRLQPLLVSMMMLGGAWYLSTFIEPMGFLKLLSLAPIVFVVSFFIFYVLGLQKEKREELRQIVTSIKFFKSA